jgi:tetratricopeptide (TPR) repeat protein
VLLVTLLLLFSYVPPSRAASETPDCEKEPACQGLWLRARELSQQGKIIEAQRMYQMAYDLRADPRLLFNVARVLHKQGLTAEAAPYYQRFLDSSLDDAGQKQKARDYLEEIRKTEPKRPVTPQAGTPEPGSRTDSTLIPDGAAPRPDPGAAGAQADAKATARPVYKKWWFWTILGVAAAGVATGVAVGVTRSPSAGVDPVPGDATLLRPMF